MDVARPDRATRLAARLLTGGPGHLAGGMADWASLLAAIAWRRLRRARPG